MITDARIDQLLDQLGILAPDFDKGRTLVRELLAEQPAYRDAMAVAVAVREACAKLAMNAPIAADTLNDDGKATAWKARADISRLDISAIVEVVQPVAKPEPVNQQAVHRLIKAVDAFFSYNDEYHTDLNRAALILELGKATDAARPAAEAAPPASAQQQGEPVAVVDECDDGLFVEILYGENGSSLKCGDKLYTTPSAPACSVPEGWQSLLREAVGVARCVGVSEAAITFQDIDDANAFIKKAEAMLAAAQQGGA